MRNTIYIIGFAIILLSLSHTISVANPNDHNKKVIKATNLMLLSEESAHTNRPLLLLISRKGCPYCTLIKKEILQPMLISGEYADKIIIREIIINTGSTLIDFDGSTIDTANLADRFRTNLTPTLLFLGPDGKELADRIVGINTIELFSYYVDQAIDEAALNLKSR